MTLRKMAARSATWTGDYRRVNAQVGVNAILSRITRISCIPRRMHATQVFMLSISCLLTECHCSR